jgi:glycosyltransferase involved in cell wall biosynthesis
MRILFVTPYPPSRIRVRSYGFLTQLQREHEVTIATQVTSEQELTDVGALRAQGFAVVTTEETKRQAVLRSGMALLGSLPLQVAYARSQRFTQEVQQLWAQRTFDVVHVEHLRGIASMESLARAHPLVWDAVDCISLLSKQTMVGGPSLPVRAVALLEHKRTQSYEGKILQMLPHVLVTSERDRQAMIELRRTQTGNATGRNEEADAGIRVLPNGVDLAYFSPFNQERRRFNVVFSGKMSYHANIATALYLYRQIMPLIWQQQPETTLTIVGSKPPLSIQQLARDSRVEVTGYVEDLRPYVGRAQVMLSPMVYSVGIQNKVLEAMALGTPVVVAAQAAAALGTRSGRDLMVASSANEFAELTLRLMNDAELHSTLSQCGRTYVEQQHDWRVIADRLVDVYRQAIIAYMEGSTSHDIATSFLMPSKSI